MLNKIGITTSIIGGIVLTLWLSSILLPMGIGAFSGFKSTYHENKGKYFQSTKFDNCTNLPKTERTALTNEQFEKKWYWLNFSNNCTEFGFNALVFPIIVAEKLIKQTLTLRDGRNC